jgi:beta-glucanase (GH16 family)
MSDQKKSLKTEPRIIPLIWLIAIFVCDFAAVAFAQAQALEGPAPLGARSGIPAAATERGFNRLIFSEQFDKPVFDGAGPSSEWYNSMWYQPERSLDRFLVKDGILEIRSEPDGSDVSLTTLRRDTRGGALFHFGYFEARMKWDSSPQTWAAFWLFSSEHAKGIDGGHWCEIDIIESMKPFTFTGTVHSWINFRSTHNLENDVYLGPTYNTSVWHNYGLLFSENEIIWFLDGKQILSSVPPSICLSQHLFLTLTSQVHGKSLGQRPIDVQVPQRSVFVDWVRVYSK